MAFIRIVTESGELIKHKDLCISFDMQLRPLPGEYIRTIDGKRRYKILSSEWRNLEGEFYGLIMTIREMPLEEEPIAEGIIKPNIKEMAFSNSRLEFPHFFLRYRCKNCGTKYGRYPEQCHCCGGVGCFEDVEPEYQSLM